jgi:hypothetical protein
VPLNSKLPYNYLAPEQEEQILNYYKHTLLTQVMKILPDDAFFDSLKCPENAPFCVQ